MIRVSRSLIPRVLHNPQCTTTPNQGSAALRRGSTGLGTHAGWNRGRQRMGRRWRHPRPGTAWRPDWPRDHRRGAQEVVGGGLVTGRLQQIDDDTAARGHRARLSRLARRRPRLDARPGGTSSPCSTAGDIGRRGPFRQASRTQERPLEMSRFSSWRTGLSERGPTRHGGAKLGARERTDAGGASPRRRQQQPGLSRRRHAGAALTLAAPMDGRRMQPKGPPGTRKGGRPLPWAGAAARSGYRAASP